MYATHNHHHMFLIGAAVLLWGLFAWLSAVIGAEDWKEFMYLMALGFVVVSLFAGNLTPFIVFVFAQGALMLITMAVNLYKMTRE